MVYLTMTTGIVHALKEIRNNEGQNAEDSNQNWMKQLEDTDISIEDVCYSRKNMGSTSNASSNVDMIDTSFQEPSLKLPQVGNPISHAQIIELSKRLQARNSSSASLDALLRGARVYIPPPPPKPEPVSCPSPFVRIIWADVTT